MGQQFLAVIEIVQPVGGGPVDPGYGKPTPPEMIWGGRPMPHPEHPIVLPPEAPGEPPNVIWPSPGHPAHPIAPGGPPPVVSPPIYYPPVISGGPGSLPPFVMPPIALPPVIWPEPPDGGPPIAIDPGHPEHPIVIPPPPNVVWPPDVHVEHPIVLPLPPEIWPKPPLYPSHPIVIPPTDPERQKLFTWKTGWSEKTGWVVVAVPNFPTPTPSAKVATAKKVP